MCMFRAGKSTHGTWAQKAEAQGIGTLDGAAGGMPEEMLGSDAGDEGVVWDDDEGLLDAGDDDDDADDDDDDIDVDALDAGRC